VKDKGLLIDSGPLVALLNERDQHHTVCVNQAKQLRGPFYTSWPVITEAAHLLSHRSGAVLKLLVWVQTLEIQIIPITASDAPGISDIISRYSDQGFDFADATLMHLADRDGLSKVFTIDHRHFSVYRISRRKPFTIVPAML
jgi:predicted nucleic acid-binding protein